MIMVMIMKMIIISELVTVNKIPKVSEFCVTVTLKPNVRKGNIH